MRPHPDRRCRRPSASVVKVDILATLLLQAPDQGRRLSTEERAHSAAMIQKSDSESTSALWTRTGSASGLDAADERLDLVQTQGGSGNVWGKSASWSRRRVRPLRRSPGSSGRSPPPDAPTETRDRVDASTGNLGQAAAGLGEASVCHRRCRARCTSCTCRGVRPQSPPVRGGTTTSTWPTAPWVPSAPTSDLRSHDLDEEAYLVGPRATGRPERWRTLVAWLIPPENG